MLTRYPGTWTGHFGTLSLRKEISDVVVADATAVHGNRNAVLFMLMSLTPLHYTRS
jgi:hypothetical protein